MYSMKKKILVVGRDPQTLQGAVNMLNENGYEAHGENIDENALETFKKFNFDGVLLGGGVGPRSQEVMLPVFKAKNPDIKVVQAHPWQALEALRVAFEN